MIKKLFDLAQDALTFPEIRVGQAHMNALNEVFPSIHAKIVGTDADPFYNDSKMDAFWMKVAGSLVKVTGNELEREFFYQLGVMPDADSRPELLEWYWRMPVEEAEAAAALFLETFTPFTGHTLKYSSL